MPSASLRSYAIGPLCVSDVRLSLILLEVAFLGQVRFEEREASANCQVKDLVISFRLFMIGLAAF